VSLLPVPGSFSGVVRKGGLVEKKKQRPETGFDKTWNILKYIIVGMMETVALGSMIGASIFLTSPGGSLAILLGLVVGILGLVIYDGWKM
jgi:hypothetical protein